MTQAAFELTDVVYRNQRVTALNRLSLNSLRPAGSAAWGERLWEVHAAADPGRSLLS